MARPQVAMVWAEEDTEAALRARYRAASDGRVRMRLQGLWLLRQDWSVDAVAAAVGVHRRTVDRWTGGWRGIARAAWPACWRIGKAGSGSRRA
jgi:hypothetical protein